MHMLYLIALLLPCALAASTCLRFADSSSINRLLSDGGPGTKILLCPSKTYRLSGTIIFTAADQEIATYGYPTGSERATLRVESAGIATAIQGDCRRCARVSVRNLVVEGNRQKLGRSDLGGLVVIGGEAQSIVDCALRDPRGFTAIHVREGDKLSCKGAIIQNNDIGPVGDEYDPSVDGDDPETSPLGRPLADGVTVACRDSFVRDNDFVDNTDAAVVVYGSPGTLVEGNRITATKVSPMAGILMVDAAPFDGDYSGMVVKGNVIDAERYIRIGIGIGAAILSDDTDTVLRGGTVMDNEIKGSLGYGIAAAGLDGWTVTGNKDIAHHQGERSSRCFDEFVNPEPVRYLWHESSISKSQFQPEFVDGEFQYALCIDDSEEVVGHVDRVKKVEVKEPKVEPVPVPEPVTPEAEGDFSTGSVVMDDILEHSQLRMLETIAGLLERVDRVKPGVVSLDGVGQRIDAAERRQRTLAQAAEKLHEGFQSWQSGFDRLQNEADALVQEVKKVEVGVSPVVQLVVVQGAAGLVFWLGSSWWKRRRRHDKRL